MAKEQSDPTDESIRSILRSAIQAAKAGRRAEARGWLRQVVSHDPSNEVAWLWLAGTTHDLDEALDALNHVGHLNPNHPALEAARHWTWTRSWPETKNQADDELPQAGVVAFTELPAATSLDNEWPGQPNLETVPSVPISSPNWPRRFWLGLVSLAVALTICVLVGVIWVQVDSVQARLPASPTPDQSGRVLALQPELNAALTDSRWEDAIAVLQVMRALDPENRALENELAQVYYQLALRRRDKSDLDGAITALQESLDLVPDDLSIQKELRLLDAYRQGMAFHQVGDWQGTIRTLASVRRQDTDYLDVTEVLYSAYYNLGLSQQAASDLVGAQASYQSALELMPEETLAREKADEVALLLRPPTPVPTPMPTPTPESGPQRIVVDISEQRMYVYEGEKLVWEWVVSTGEPGRDTAVGDFAIQSKIPMAYASTWNLDMPHWLGIYWSGPLENGIHALPIKRDTGYKLWDGFLGQRVSYGCVILDDENAETLFNWVEMGTPVKIQP
jgi:tetratricopeptide (TPR) repeat protein